MRKASRIVGRELERLIDIVQRIVIGLGITLGVR